MKVLVTGATGFLGHRLSQRLKKMGLHVYGTGRDIKVGAALENEGIEFIATDLGRPLENRKFPEKVDWIVHCAALSSPWGRPEVFHKCNVFATHQMINYGLRTDCKRFVHISSPSIYVDKIDRLNVKEDDPLPQRSLNLYISTKRLAELEVDEGVRQGLSAITLRPQGIVGRGDRSIFPRILELGKKGVVPRIGGGQTQTDLTHVENVIDAIVSALNASSELNGRKYNITNGEPVELYQIIESLLTTLGIRFRWKNMSLRKAYALGAMMEWSSRNLFNYKEPLLTRYTACALGASRTLDIQRARKELGYSPKISISQALKEVTGDLGGH